jgi:protein-disulfide isomerase-like protein with CxxC motif
MDLPAFRVTWDYRCPFARNAHEHLVEALEDGAPWQVTFVPFSLSQVHVEEGQPPVWDNSEAWPDLLALEAAVVVRNRYPEVFLDVHRALFAARHDEGSDLRDREVVSKALEAGGAKADEVLAEVDAGWPRVEVRKAHEEAAERFGVFGVPTFIVGEHAAFVRLMDRPLGDTTKARVRIEQVLELLVNHPEVNEFKHTRVSR